MHLIYFHILFDNKTFTSYACMHACVHSFLLMCRSRRLLLLWNDDTMQNKLKYFTNSCVEGFWFHIHIYIVDITHPHSDTFTGAKEWTKLMKNCGLKHTCTPRQARKKTQTHITNDVARSHFLRVRVWMRLNCSHPSLGIPPFLFLSLSFSFAFAFGWYQFMSFSEWSACHCWQMVYIRRSIQHSTSQETSSNKDIFMLIYHVPNTC